jgi:hypothetical protein
MNTNRSHVLYGGKIIKISNNNVNLEAGAGIICSFRGDDGVIAKRRVSWKDKPNINVIKLDHLPFAFFYVNLSGKIIITGSQILNEETIFTHLQLGIVSIISIPIGADIDNSNRFIAKIQHPVF